MYITPSPTDIYTLSLHDALPIFPGAEEAIYDKISDITISMKSADHLKMPELVNSRYMVRLDEPELVKYEDRKSTRLNSSHVSISYAVFCLKKKKYDRSLIQVMHI